MAADSIDALRARVRGEIVQPFDAAYDWVRKVYNGMVDKRPGLIVRCVDAADVITTVNFARDEHALVAIRGGGHNGAGLGTCEGGLVIDLSLMKGVHVQAAARTARVGGGCTWAEVDRATHAFGMAVPSGMISTTGVGGLTLGGGIGHLSRKYGLTIDNLLAVDLVLADGRFVTASEKENQDLFWAVRGGGGNFGVATSFLFRTHPVETVYAGPTFWPLEEAADLMRRYREFIVEAPEDVSGFFAFLVVPPAPMFPERLHNRKMCGIVWCCTAPAAKAAKAIEPMIRFREPALSMVDSLPFPVLQSMFDALYTPGLQWYWKADYFKELSDPAVALHLQHASRIPTMFSTMHLYPINGAVHRVGAGDTAFSCRDANWAEVIVGVDPDPANADKIIDWTRSYWDALHPYSVGSAYVNFMMEEGQDRVRSSYGENYRRLAAIKRKYDPANFFRVNQNIQPAAASAAG